MKSLVCALGLHYPQISVAEELGSSYKRLDLERKAQIIFDAERSEINLDKKQYRLTGNTLLLFKGRIVSATNVLIDRAARRIEATGKIILVDGASVFVGSKLVIDLAEGLFSLDQAKLTTFDREYADSQARKILGHTERETAFEEARVLRLREIANSEIALLTKYRKSVLTAKEQERLIADYEKLMAQKKLIESQVNPMLASIDGKKREFILRRRSMFEKNRQSVAARENNKKSYLRLSGEKIFHEDPNRFGASSLFITPCDCEEDEIIPWGFSAQNLVFHQEGYANLSNATLRIMGAPILYIPKLKIPIKKRRQSGFLVPEFSHSTQQGTVYSFPLFLNLSPHEDLTLNLDEMTKRGVRLGGEYRIRRRGSAFFDIRVQGLRDRSWLQQNLKRKELTTRYRQAFNEAKSAVKNPTSPLPVTVGEASTPQWWRDQGYDACLQKEIGDDCEEQIFSGRIAPPENLYRGILEWQGRSLFDSGLKLHTGGELVSDHRYMQDVVYEPTTLVPGQDLVERKLFSKNFLHLNYQADSYSLDVGSTLIDHMIDPQFFGGHQLPLSLDWSSRLYRIGRNPWLGDAYGRINFKHRRLSFLKRFHSSLSKSNQSIEYILGDGQWSSARAKLLSFLDQGNYVNSEWSLDLDMRQVEGSMMSTLNSVSSVSGDTTSEGLKGSFVSPKFSLSISLPLVGEFPLYTKEDELGYKISEFSKHKMSWNIEFSSRPFTSHTGNYGLQLDRYLVNANNEIGSAQDGAVPLIYFDTDTLIPSDSPYVNAHSKLIPHQILKVSTHHVWSFFSQSESNQRSKKALSGATLNGDNGFEKDASSEVASLVEQKLMNHPVLSKASHVPSKKSHNTTISFDADVGYDFKKSEEEGRALSELEKTIQSPWSPVNAQINAESNGYRLATQLKYDLANKNYKELRVIFTPRKFLGVQPEFNYDILQNFVRPEDGSSIRVEQTVTGAAKISFSIMSRIRSNLYYGVRNYPQQEREQQTAKAFVFDYSSPSRCWGLQASWHNDFSSTDQQGTYLLALTVDLFGVRRNLGNLVERANQVKTNS